MYNKKTLAVIGMTALMLVTMAGCGSKNSSAAEVNTTTSTTAAVENVTKAAATEAVTEAQTETQAASEEVTEAVTEAQAEVVETPAEAPVQAEVVNEAPVVVEVPAQVVEEKPEVVTEAPTEAPTQKKIVSPTDADGTPLPISDVKKNGATIVNADGTVTTGHGTFASSEDFVAWAMKYLNGGGVNK
ncbi:MAG: hypothetical protein ACI4D0_01930 [Lachnospira sp.]